MKTVQFQGQTYEAPDWAKYVTSDMAGIYVWANKPLMSKLDGCFIYEDDCERIADNNPLGVCEELP